MDLACGVRATFLLGYRPMVSGSRIFAPRFVLGWVLFTLAAGIVNATALMACDSFVTNLTGSMTSLGLRSVATRALLVVIASFMAGAMLAVLAMETLRPRIHAAFALPVVGVFSILVAIGVAGKAGVFGAFGEPLGGRETFVMLSLLAFASGLLNAAVANATANRVRVTHVTGPATDLAGNLVRAVLDAGEGSRLEGRWAMLRIAKLVSFVAGAAIAARLSDRLGYDTFVVAAAVVILALGAAGAPPLTTPSSPARATAEPTENPSPPFE